MKKCIPKTIFNMMVTLVLIACFGVYCWINCQELRKSDHAVWGVGGDIMLILTLYMPILSCQLGACQSLQGLLFHPQKSPGRILLRAVVLLISCVILVMYCLWLSQIASR